MAITFDPNLGVDTGTQSNSMLQVADVSRTNDAMRQAQETLNKSSTINSLLGDLNSFVQNAQSGIITERKVAQEKKNINDTNQGIVDQLKNPLAAPDADEFAQAGASPHKFAAARKVYLASQKEDISMKLSEIAESATSIEDYSSKVSAIADSLDQSNAEEALLRQSVITGGQKLLQDSVEPRLKKAFVEAQTVASNEMIARNVQAISWDSAPADIQKQITQIQRDSSGYRALGVSGKEQLGTLLNGLQLSMSNSDTVTREHLDAIVGSRSANGMTLGELAIANGQADTLRSLYAAIGNKESARASALEKANKDAQSDAEAISKDLAQRYQLTMAADEVAGKVYSPEEANQLASDISLNENMTAGDKLSVLSMLSQRVQKLGEVSATEDSVSSIDLAAPITPDMVKGYKLSKQLTGDTAVKTLDKKLATDIQTVLSSTTATPQERQSMVFTLINQATKLEPNDLAFVKNSLTSALSGEGIDANGNLIDTSSSSNAVLQAYMSAPDLRTKAYSLGLPDGAKRKLQLIATMVDRGVPMNQALLKVNGQDPTYQPISLQEADKIIEAYKAEGDTQFGPGSTDFRELPGKYGFGYNVTEAQQRVLDSFYKQRIKEDSEAGYDVRAVSWLEKLGADKNAMFLAIDNDNLDTAVKIDPKVSSLLAANRAQGLTGLADVEMRNNVLGKISTDIAIALQNNKSFNTSRDTIRMTYSLENTKSGQRIFLTAYPGNNAPPLKMDVQDIMVDLHKKNVKNLVETKDTSSTIGGKYTTVINKINSQKEVYSNPEKYKTVLEDAIARTKANSKVQGIPDIPPSLVGIAPLKKEKAAKAVKPATPFAGPFQGYSVSKPLKGNRQSVLSIPTSGIPPATIPVGPIPPSLQQAGITFPPMPTNN